MTPTAREAYARRAGEYIEHLGDIAAVHPADLELVTRWAGGVGGPVLDAGCGPGHWTAHLVGGFFHGDPAERFDHAVAPAYRWSIEALTERVRAVGFEVVETSTRTAPGARPHGAIVAQLSTGCRGPYGARVASRSETVRP